MPTSIIAAGSTERTVRCLESLAADKRFAIQAVITPIPKPVGRKQRITRNPVDLWAETNHVACYQITTSLSELRDTYMTLPQPDILLVVDFGYYLPNWLLSWPTIGPINVHPSALPRWRGSSPGQFVLLHGELDSAVSVIEMTSELDQGAIIAQLPFTVKTDWTQQEYYANSFALLAAQLPDVLSRYATAPTATAQPKLSPTPVAVRLNKADAHIPWTVVMMAISAVPYDSTALERALGDNQLLQAARTAAGNDAAVLVDRAIRAFQPWPEAWTYVPTAQGPQRLKLQRARLIDQPAAQTTSTNQTQITQAQLVLTQVCLEGKAPTDWELLRPLVVFEPK